MRLSKWQRKFIIADYVSTQHLQMIAAIPYPLANHQDVAKLVCIGLAVPKSTMFMTTHGGKGRKDVMSHATLRSRCVEGARRIALRRTLKSVLQKHNAYQWKTLIFHLRDSSIGCHAA